MSAIDRAGFLGVALAAAGAGVADAQTTGFGQPHAPIVAENDPAIRVVQPRLRDGAIGAYAALPATITATTPGVVMVPHIWNIDAQFRDLARRLAKAGYIAIAPGIFDRIDAQRPASPADIAPFATVAKQMYAAGAELGDIHAARAWIAAQAPRGKIGLYGNCMGGGIALQALAGTTDFVAASVLYGYVRADRQTSQPPPPGAFDWARSVRAAVLGSYAADDGGIAPADVTAAFALLPGPHDLKIYPNAPHAFLDDTRPSYRPGPSADAWARQLAWFAQYLATA